MSSTTASAARELRGPDRPLPALGEACTGANSCRDEGPYCNSMTMLCTQVGLPGDACSLTSRCSPYYDCAPASMQCVRGAAIGEACTMNLDCFHYGTYCKADLCAPREATGGPCMDDGDCAGEFCGPANTCLPRPTCP